MIIIFIPSTILLPRNHTPIRSIRPNHLYVCILCSYVSFHTLDTSSLSHHRLTISSFVRLLSSLRFTHLSRCYHPDNRYFILQQDVIHSYRHLSIKQILPYHPYVLTTVSHAFMYLISNISMLLCVVHTRYHPSIIVRLLSSLRFTHLSRYFILQQDVIHSSSK